MDLTGFAIWFLLHINSNDRNKVVIFLGNLLFLSTEQTNKQTTTKTEAAGFFHRLTMIEMTKSSHCCVKIVEVSHSETKEEKMEYVSHYVSCRFSPAIFLFLVSIIPSIWILEIHHQQNKLTEAKVHISHKWRLELE